MNAVLGVGGGIAAYKSAELARALMERGFHFAENFVLVPEIVDQSVGFCLFGSKRPVVDDGATDPLPAAHLLRHGTGQNRLDLLRYNPESGF